MITMDEMGNANNGVSNRYLTRDLESASRGRDAERALKSLDDRIEQRQAIIEKADDLNKLYESGSWKPVIEIFLADWRRLKAEFLTIDPAKFEVLQARARLGYDVARMMAQAMSNRKKLHDEQAQDVSRREMLGVKYGRT